MDFHQIWYVHWYCGDLLWDCSLANFVNFWHLPAHNMIMGVWGGILFYKVSYRGPWASFFNFPRKYTLTYNANCLLCMKSQSSGKTYEKYFKMSAAEIFSQHMCYNPVTAKQTCSRNSKIDMLFFRENNRGFTWNIMFSLEYKKYIYFRVLSTEVGICTLRIVTVLLSQPFADLYLLQICNLNIFIV